MKVLRGGPSRLSISSSPRPPRLQHDTRAVGLTPLPPAGEAAAPRGPPASLLRVGAARGRPVRAAGAPGAWGTPRPPPPAGGGAPAPRPAASDRGPARRL